MSLERWSSEPDPDVLGVVVHGPVVVARSTGIALGVRAVFARPDGLDIELALRATGVQAEGAGRQSFGSRGSELRLTVELDGRRAIAHPSEQSSSGGQDAFASDLRVAIGELPSDGTVTLTVSWPEAGLAEASVALVLAPLDNLTDRVVRLAT